MGVNYAQTGCRIELEQEKREYMNALERENELIERDEKFQMKIEDKRLSSINNLSNSISNLALAIANKPTQVINIFLGADTSSDKIIDIVNKFKENA